ncbi:MAG: response regulator [Candidatus Moraniibacteriota bacterium]
MEIRKILVVEDERAIAKAMELKLNFSGFKASVAYNGLEALEILKKEKFDLIIVDLIMPKLDGFGTMRAIKELKIKTPIVVSSNLNQDEDLKKAKELGAVDFFVKSNIPISKLVENIKKILG